MRNDMNNPAESADNLTARESHGPALIAPSEALHLGSATPSVDGSEATPQPGKNVRPQHPILAAIDRFLQRARDIETIARVYMPLSFSRRRKRLEALKLELTEVVDLINSGDEATLGVGMRRFQKALRDVDRLRQSQVPQVLESSLFLGLFSAYDAYTGELLTAIYKKKPALFRSIGTSVTVGEIMGFASLEELQDSILQDEIESFRRKSYIDQFSDLESKFGVSLREFERWPQFVECGQRRNLVTHCGGIVSEQYLEICKREGVALDKELAIGSQLRLGGKYFLPACALMMEVGLKLGQTLWRKVFPEELEEADKHLQAVIYDALQDELWQRAKTFAEFATSQKRMGSDVDKKIALVNLAIALKFGGDPTAAATLLSSVDWSAASNDFKLAERVLMDEFGEAATIVRRIGKAGDILTEEAYHVWPLFREFRSRAEFLEAYEEVYGRPFIVELQRAADKAEAATDMQLKKEEPPEDELVNEGGLPRLADAPSAEAERPAEGSLADLPPAEQEINE